MVRCHVCNGDGYTDYDEDGNEIPCWKCDGTGELECSYCKGTGEIDCPVCS